MKQRILLITPPFTQLNTPYPATAYLKGFLNTKDIASFQVDLGLEVILQLFSREGFTKLFQEISARGRRMSDNSRRIFNLRQEYVESIDPVIAFLQGKEPSLAHIICNGNFLPEASRFDQLDDLEWAFGTMGMADKAKHLATLYLEDISDLIIDTLDPHFGFSRYAEQLGRSASSFEELYHTLHQDTGFIENILIHLLKTKVDQFHPTVVGLSVPFPGNLLCAFQCAKWIKQNKPDIKIILGGGFANTELRSMQEIRVFEYFDAITFDDGEAPLFHYLEYLEGTRDIGLLKRTLVIENEMVDFKNGSTEKDFARQNTGTPDYSDLLLDRYISVIEIVNPMHRLWSDGRWNKLTLAHGCYWGRCTFCDTSLDYIKRFEPNTTAVLCDQIETLIRQTGTRGFHFVDEAAPPALLRALALEILRRNIKISWWTNIRFERNFTRDLCLLLRDSGCIAVSGGLEVASDRILKLINKGVSIQQVARVTDHFTQAGIMVHAYLMYGFPTQTAQETIDSLEVVRQLFRAGLVQSGFWHHFALTAHSPVGQNPEPYQIRITNTQPGLFAHNDLLYTEFTETDHEAFSEGLRKSLFNFMHGIGFEFDLQEWFDFKIPKTSLSGTLIQEAITLREEQTVSPHQQIVWTGPLPLTKNIKKTQKGREQMATEMIFHLKKHVVRIVVQVNQGKWLENILARTRFDSQETLTMAQLEQDFEAHQLGDFDLFRFGKAFLQLRENGLLFL